MIQAKYRRELIPRENSKTEAKSSNSFAPKVNSTPKDKSSCACYSCGDRGHQAKDCPKKEKGIKCFACNQYGHKASACKTKEQKNDKEKKTEVLLAKEPISHGVYQDVMIEGIVCIPALIDTGSSVNLIKATEYLKSGSPSLNRDTIKLHSIGTAEIETLGSFETTLKINEQYFKTSVHVIPDDAMTPRMLIGNKLLKNIEVLISRGEVKTIKKVEDHTEKNEIAEILNIEVENEKEDLNVAHVQFQEDINRLVEDYKPEPTRHRYLYEDYTY